MNDCIPDGWKSTTLARVASTQLGKTINPKERGGPNQRPYLRNANVQWDRVDVADILTMQFSEAEAQRFQLKPGDLLTCEGGIVGRSAIWNGDIAGCCFQNAIHRIRPLDEEVSAEWLLENIRYLSESGALAIRARGNTIQHLSQQELRNLPVVFPTRQEQDAIINVLNGTRSIRLSTSSHLEAARLATKRFRQAVLAAACYGRLTEDWRETRTEHTSAPEILSELRSKKRVRINREEAVSLAIAELPETYIVSTLGECALVLEYGTSKRCVADPSIGIPVLRMGNIQDGRVDLGDLKYCAVDDEIDRLMLKSGDLLFNRTNSPELVGKSAIYESDMPASFASYLIRVRFDDRAVLPEFVNYWLNSAWGHEWARLAKTDGVSQSNINGSKLALMPIPLPPIEEQLVIVERASRMLISSESLLVRIGLASKVMERSSLAVLAKAFQGQLIGVSE